MTKSASKHGFTLLELLVVIALMGVATSMGMVMLSRVSDQWRSTSVRASLDDRAAYVFGQIRQDLADVLSASLSGLSIQGVSQTASSALPGAAAVVPDDTLTIPVELAPAPNAPLQRAGITYHIERKDDECTLMRTARLAANKAAGASLGSVKVADGVLAMRVEYQGRAAGDAWQPQWSKPSLPGAVRVSITLRDPERTYEQIARKAVFPIEVE